MGENEVISKFSPKVSKLLMKGEDMTTGDIQYLLKREVNYEVIAEAINMTPIEFKVLIEGPVIANTNNQDNEKCFEPLSENDKNELVEKYKNIVFYYVKKYRYLDEEKDDIAGWGFLGFAKALDQYDKNRGLDFVSLVFSEVKMAIYSCVIRKRYKPKSEQSLQVQILEGKDGSVLTLEETIPDDSCFSFTMDDIRNMVEEALFEETNKSTRIVMDWLFADKSIEQLAKENNISQTLITRTQRRGKALIKNYLINNDIILDYLMDPNEKQRKEKMIFNHKKITKDDYGKIKYLKRNFSFFTINDIALLINTSSYAVMQLLDYPTTDYMKSCIDPSIHQNAIKYTMKKYPERMPGDVTVLHC
jgi:RNA polymerase sigma factor (sigma-70 family)